MSFHHQQPLNSAGQQQHAPTTNNEHHQNSLHSLIRSSHSPVNPTEVPAPTNSLNNPQIVHSNMSLSPQQDFNLPRSSQKPQSQQRRGQQQQSTPQFMPNAPQNQDIPNFGFNFNPQDMMNAFAMMSATMSEQDDSFLVDALVEATLSGATYKDALNGLHGVNGKSASLWKDWYLEHKSRFDPLVSARLNPSGLPPAPRPKPVATIKPPQFRPSPSPPPSRSSSSRPSASGTSKLKTNPASRQSSVASVSQPPKPKGRKTFNSIAAPTAVFDRKLPAPNTELVIPDPPSRSPSPPTNLVQARLGYKFTPEDQEFFIKFISYEMKKDPDLTRKDLVTGLAEKAPHHNASSWYSYWSTHHDMPDKIVAHYRHTGQDEKMQGDDFSASSVSESDVDSSSDEDTKSNHPQDRSVYRKPVQAVQRARKRSPKRNISSPLITHSDNEMEDEILSWDSEDMGRKGEAFNDADRGVLAQYMATFNDWKVMTGRERWDDFCAKYPARSAASWREYYRRNQRDLDDLSAKIKHHKGTKRRSGAAATPGDVNGLKRHAPQGTDDNLEPESKRGKHDF